MGAGVLRTFQSRQRYLTDMLFGWRCVLSRNEGAFDSEQHVDRYNDTLSSIGIHLRPTAHG